MGNKEISKDIAYATAKALTGSIPVVGAAAAELLQLLITPPLEKRKDKWMQEIGSKIVELQQREKVNIEELKNKEEFIDVVLEATSLAIKTSEKEKIKYYRNIILNVAVEENPDLPEIQIFLNVLSNFTVWHVKILYLFADPEDWSRKNGVKFTNYLSAGLSNILEEAYPELRGKEDFYNIIWSDLHRVGFHRTSGLGVMMSGNGLMAKRTTELGNKFLDFILENPLD